MMKRYWKGSDLQIEINITDKKGNTIPFANLDELVIYLKTTGEEYVKVSKGSGIESDVDGNIYIRLNEHSLDYLPDGLLRYDARWKISVEGWDNGYDTVQSCETDIFVKTPDNYVPKANVQEKAVTYTANGDYVLTPDGSYEGMSKADIKVELPMESKSVTYTANGDYSVVPSEGYDGIQDVAIHIEIDTSEAENDGVMKFLRKQVTGKVELPIEAINTPYCLYGQTGVTEVVVPEGIREIPEGFFQKCTSLEKITYPDTITLLRKSLYYGIDKNVRKQLSIPPYLQNSCNNLTIYAGETFDMPKYINGLDSTFNDVQVEGESERVNFKGHFGYFYFSWNNEWKAKIMDFRHNIKIPTFGNKAPYSGMTKVIVPESLYDTWITTSPWSNYSGITETVPDINYYIPYQTVSGEDIALTGGIFDSRYAIISSLDKKVLVRGTPWSMISQFAGIEDISFIDFEKSGLELPSFRDLFFQCKGMTGCTLPANKPLEIYRMFSDCSSLISAPEMDTSNVISEANMMFRGCSNLQNIPEYDFRFITSTTLMLYYCGNLKNLGGFVGLKVSTDFSSSPLLTHESLMNVITKAADVTANPQTLAFGSTNLAKLTDEEKAIAISKGWTLT